MGCRECFDGNRLKPQGGASSRLALQPTVSVAPLPHRPLRRSRCGERALTRLFQISLPYLTYFWERHPGVPVSICNMRMPRRPALRARLSTMMFDCPEPRSSSPELPNTHPCTRANGMATAPTPRSAGAAPSDAHLSPRSPEPLPPSPMVPRRAARIAHAMVLSCVAVRRGCAAAARWRRLARRRRRAPLLTRRGLAARSARLPGRRPPARS